MINLQNFKRLVAANPSIITTDDFIKMHKGVEGYIRRLLFIGLRLNGVKYETALEVINMSYLNNRDLLKKTIILVTKNTQTLTGFESHNPDFKQMVDLFFDFTSIYRNRVIHGVYENINDQRVLKHCYYIDKYFVEEFELTLRTLGYNSAYDQPNVWGATRSTGTETFNVVIARLKLGILTKSPKGIISVMNAITMTKYNGRI